MVELIKVDDLESRASVAGNRGVINDKPFCIVRRESCLPPTLNVLRVKRRILVEQHHVAWR